MHAEVIPGAFYRDGTPVYRDGRRRGETVHADKTAHPLAGRRVDYASATGTLAGTRLLKAGPPAPAWPEHPYAAGPVDPSRGPVDRTAYTQTRYREPEVAAVIEETLADHADDLGLTDLEVFHFVPAPLTRGTVHGWYGRPGCTGFVVPKHRTDVWVRPDLDLDTIRHAIAHECYHSWEILQRRRCDEDEAQLWARDYMRRHGRWPS